MAGDFETIIYEKREGVAWITINRPEVRNAMNSKVRTELKEALKKAEADPEVKAVVITGAGGNFAAGADLREFAELSPEEMKNWLDQYGIQTVAEIITKMGKPVVAAVDGFCLGGGLELAMACDMIIATDRARFGQPEIRVGLIPGGGGTQRLPRLVGPHKAKEYIFTGNIIDASEAERIGLVNMVVPPEQLTEAVEKLLKRIVDKSPIMLKLAKEAVNAALELPLSKGLEYEKELFLKCWATEDRLEGVRAFLEKRKPVFKGR